MKPTDLPCRLCDAVERRSERLRRAARERHQWLSQTLSIGTLGLVFVLPVVGGAYLGTWLDERLAGYSQSWTLSLILLGVLVGALNVYLLIRED
jgi:ATP synthase protein I